MNDSFGGGFTQAAGAEAKTESKAEGTLPIFIKMIQKQADVDTIQMFGQEYKMVTLVAVVKNIEHASTKITYELEDFSGRILAHLWVDEDTPRNENIMINSYVRVVGGVRTQNLSKSIMIYKIHPVSGINEVNTHYIEVINARFAAEEFAGKAGAPLGNKMDVDTPAVKSAAGATDASTADSDQPDLNPKERVVFKMMQSALVDSSVEGYHRNVVYERFPHFSRDEIDSMLEKMSTEGLLYTTIDNDHFQACF